MMKQKSKKINKTATNKPYKSTISNLISRRPKTINSEESSLYRTKHSWSVIWEAVWCYWKRFKSRGYNKYMNDVNKFKMDTSLENILISIQTLKTQVQYLSEQNNTPIAEPSVI